MEENNKTIRIEEEIIKKAGDGECEAGCISEESGQDKRQPVGFWKDDRGVGVIEVVLILVVLIGLVLIFKDQITSIVNNAFASITGDAGEIIK